MTPEHKKRLRKVEKTYGPRQLIPMGHSAPLWDHHFRGMMDDNTKFVYCPIGFLISWHPRDYDEEWCAWCEKYFSEI